MVWSLAGLDLVDEAVDEVGEDKLDTPEDNVGEADNFFETGEAARSSVLLVLLFLLFFSMVITDM